MPCRCMPCTPCSQYPFHPTLTSGWVLFDPHIEHHTLRRSCSQDSTSATQQLPHHLPSAPVGHSCSKALAKALKSPLGVGSLHHHRC